jgi:peptide deformylase
MSTWLNALVFMWLTLKFLDAKLLLFLKRIGAGMIKYFFMTWLCAVSCFGTENILKEEVMETKEKEFPQYLYKIISFRQWQTTQNRGIVLLPAEDDVFIHLSREDQLERILTKHWSEAPQVVILKIDTDKLEGTLVYESNQGGANKYYHLYNGSIPFTSIVESKMIFHHSSGACHSHALEIVQAGAPVLRNVARQLLKEEILSPEIQTLIEEMKATMRAAPGVGLAAPQIGKSIQLAVIEDMDHSHLSAEQLAERSRYKVPFHVIINPRIYQEGSETVEFFEGCLSVPEFLGVVPRAMSVRVECLNERAEPIVIQAKGWYARILQHEVDHLQGHLYIDRALLPTLMTEKNYVSLWKGKSVSEISKNFISGGGE